MQRAVVGCRRRVAPADATTASLLPDDAGGVDASIARMGRKSFVKDGLIPEVQSLLMLPPTEAKDAFLATISQYSLICMLLLASLLGTALNPLKPEAYPDSSPKLVAAFNFLAALITCACMYGTSIFFLEANTVEPLPAERVHAVVAKADRVMNVGSCLTAIGLNGTGPLVLIRMWIGGLEQVHCIVLTAVVGVLWAVHMDTFFSHLQETVPFNAQRWTKIFCRLRYKEAASHAAVDETVAELQYKFAPRDKSLNTKQLGAALEKYLAEVGQDVQHADETDFVDFLEQQEEIGGRLAPTTERLARMALAMVVDAEIEKMAKAAVASVGNTRSVEEGEDGRNP